VYEVSREPISSPMRGPEKELLFPVLSLKYPSTEYN
jgi:hypothetical protein